MVDISLHTSIVLMTMVCFLTVSAEGCKTMYFPESYFFKDKALVGFLFKNSKVTDESQCRAMCYMDKFDRCLSYNFISDGLTCELSQSDHRIHPENLVSRPGSLYKASENSCSCAKDQICLYNFTTNSHRCECIEGSQCMRLPTTAQGLNHAFSQYANSTTATDPSNTPLTSVTNAPTKKPFCTTISPAPSIGMNSEHANSATETPRPTSLLITSSQSSVTPVITANTTGLVGSATTSVVDSCDKKPCQNGGKCMTEDEDYRCMCKPGFMGENCQNELGKSAVSPAKNCFELKRKRPSLPSSSYWIDLDEGDPSNAFLGYCDMETDGGGWTLVWAYTFTLYNLFRNDANALTPTPKNYVNTFGNISETAPKNETDFNALDFLKWRQIGSEVFIKSNINNWIACLPDVGSFVSLVAGSMKCRMINQIASVCAEIPGKFSLISNGCRISFTKLYYYFDTNPETNWPVHDPCGKNEQNHLKNVPNPHGNIYVR